MALIFICMCLAILSVGDVLGKVTFSDCGGESKKLTIKEGSVIPDPIQYPGNVSVTADLEVLDDLPASNFALQLHLTKLDPRTMSVPCLDNFGSCEYDICALLESHRDQLCPSFPPGAKCACPMKKASYFFRNAQVAIPDFGEIFVKILQGRYEGNMTFIDKMTNTEVGCVAITFTIVPAQ